MELQSARTEMAVANQISQKFASEKDLICAIATPTAQAAYSASAGKVPVIYSAVADPAAAKLLDENGKNLPGITGTSDLLPVEKQLQMIRAFLP